MARRPDLVFLKGQGSRFVCVDWILAMYIDEYIWIRSPRTSCFGTDAPPQSYTFAAIAATTRGLAIHIDSDATVTLQVIKCMIRTIVTQTRNRPVSHQTQDTLHPDGQRIEIFEAEL